jgi:hypothetical protein
MRTLATIALALDPAGAQTHRLAAPASRVARVAIRAVPDVPLYALMLVIRLSLSVAIRARKNGIIR